MRNIELMNCAKPEKFYIINTANTTWHLTLRLCLNGICELELPFHIYDELYSVAQLLQGVTERKMVIIGCDYCKKLKR